MAVETRTDGGDTIAAIERVAPRGTPLTTREVADQLDCSRRTAYNRLERLVEDGRLRTKKVGARGRVWWIPPERDTNTSAAPEREFDGPMQAIHALTDRLLSARGYPQVTERLVVAADRFECSDVVLYRFDEDRSILYPAHGVKESGEGIPDLPAIPTGSQHPIARTYANGEPRQYSAIDDHESSPAGPSLRVRSARVVPLGTHGVLLAGHRDRASVEDRTAHGLDLLGAIGKTAYDRIAREHEFAKRREETAVLNDINVVLREIHEALVEQSTRREIEQTVCERLARSYWYSFAWIGAVDPKSQSITPRAEVGSDGYLEAVSLSIDPSVPEGRGPTGRAVRTGDISVVRDTLEDPAFATWQDDAEEYGFNGAAAIPIVHHDTVYGVLGVYTARKNAFGEDERDAIAHLGEKRVLMSDELVELEIRVPDAFGSVAESTASEPIRITHAVPVGSGRYLLYGTVPAGAERAIETLTVHEEEIEAVQTFGRDSNGSRFELHVSDPHGVAVLAEHGADMVEARIQGGDFTVTFRLPPTVNPRTVVGAFEERYPSARLTARRQVTRDVTAEAVNRRLTASLTDRQSAVLEASYLAGFFDWPRPNSGEEIANSLGISPATFHQHLRSAERKVLGDVVAGATGDTRLE